MKQKLIELKGEVEKIYNNNWRFQYSEYLIEKTERQ